MVWKLSQSLPAEQSNAVEGLCGQLASAALRVPFFVVWKLSQSLPAEQSKAVEGLCGQLASAALRVPFVRHV